MTVIALAGTQTTRPQVALTGRGGDARPTKTPSSTSWTEVRSLGSYILLDVQSDGTLLARDSQQLWRSTDEGLNWTALTVTLPSSMFFPSPIIAARVMGDGNVVCWLFSGAVYRSNANSLNTGFTQVFTTENTPAKNPTNGYGTFVYNQYALYNEYSAVKPANHAYRSTDYGANWAKVFTLPADVVSGDQHHVHNVCYDKYQDIYWIVSGDNGNRMVYYSVDSTANWIQLGAFGSMSINYIQVVPLPECVLFVTDGGATGVHRIYRRAAKNYTVADMVVAHSIATAVGSAPIGTRPIVVYGDDACCYFSFEYYDSSQAAAIGHIYASRDGVDFFDIAHSDYVPSGSGTFGVSCLMGPTASGVIYGQHNQGSGGRYLMKFAAPVWS